MINGFITFAIFTTFINLIYICISFIIIFITFIMFIIYVTFITCIQFFMFAMVFVFVTFLKLIYVSWQFYMCLHLSCSTFMFITYYMFLIFVSCRWHSHCGYFPCSCCFHNLCDCCIQFNFCILYFGPRWVKGPLLAEGKRLAWGDRIFPIWYAKRISLGTTKVLCRGLVDYIKMDVGMFVWTCKTWNPFDWSTIHFI